MQKDPAKLLNENYYHLAITTDYYSLFTTTHLLLLIIHYYSLFITTHLLLLIYYYS